MRNKDFTLEKTEELFAFLQGNNQSKNIEIAEERMPKLTSTQAFSVIYYLQEALGVIPDVYEKCDECDGLFDTDNSGHYNEKSGKFYCDGCRHLDDEEETEDEDDVEATEEKKWKIVLREARKDCAIISYYKEGISKEEAEKKRIEMMHQKPLSWRDHYYYEVESV